ncbi:hypothetical protein H4R18_001221 [Coemansia javaensis]|uniref:Uncharacterized protein n=1 Tax=Coemansia javaensis TaxID=2761396 RepID=A0A9W8HFS8_9FUNG|nr:hypothetical protein H4R18_001221 [Coemansia javaensis]
MHLYSGIVALFLASAVSAAPVARPDAVLGGVVDAVAPVTAGVGTTLNNLLGFSSSGSGGSGSGSGGSSGSSGSSGGGQGSGSGSGRGSGSSGSSGSGSSGGSGSGSSGSSGSGSAVLGGVVDAVAPVTGGLGVTLNNLLGFH